MEGTIDATILVATGALLLAGHFHLCGGDIGSMKEKILQQCQLAEAATSQIEEPRVDAAFLKIRQKVMRIATECTLHALCVALLWLLYEFGLRPGRAQAIRLASALCPYTLNILIARRKIELTKVNLRISHMLYMLTFSVFVFAGTGSDSSSNATDPVVLQAFQLSSRFSMTVFFLDTALVLPCQAFLSLAEWWSFRPAHGDGGISFVFAQVLVLVIITLLSLTLELGVRSHLRASLASADAGSMVQGFRRVLRGICDGEVSLVINIGTIWAFSCRQSSEQVPYGAVASPRVTKTPTSPVKRPSPKREETETTPSELQA